MKPEVLYRKYTFIVWKWLKIFYSKYYPSLAIYFSHLSDNWWIPRQKNCRSFEANQSSSHFRTFNTYIIKILHLVDWNLKRFSESTIKIIKIIVVWFCIIEINVCGSQESSEALTTDDARSSVYRNTSVGWKFPFVWIQKRSEILKSARVCQGNLYDS